METVLLADDERIFRAVEGTCLRRERCRLLKATASALRDVAVARRPDLLVTSLADDETRLALHLVLSESSLASVPIIVVDFQNGRAAARKALVKPAGRAAPVRVISGVRSGLETRLDAAIKKSLPILDRASDRVSVSVPVRCRVERVSFVVRTKNISPTGLFLKTEKPLARGRRFMISFSLPGAFPGGQGPGAIEAVAHRPPSRITGLCEVVRQVATGLNGEHDDLIPGMGVRFVEIEQGARTTLARFVRAGGTASRVRAKSPARGAHASH
ncbi:MAG TPA: PilZ domain-containing protein [Candidatus Polarisedimenticolia bacterium]|jgi:hypothetical protein